MDSRAAIWILDHVKEKILGAAIQWFEKDFHTRKSINRIGFNKNTEEELRQLNFHSQWIHLAKISKIPTLFLNTAEINSEFEIQDLV